MNKTEKMMSQAAQCYANHWVAMGYKNGERQAFWPEWHKTHLNNDLAVVADYNSPNATAEPKCVARFFNFYTDLIQQQEQQLIQQRQQLGNFNTNTIKTRLADKQQNLKHL